MRELSLGSAVRTLLACQLTGKSSQRQEEAMTNTTPRTSPVVYRSEVRIERVKGPVRRGYVPGGAQPGGVGVHGAVGQHHKVAPRAGGAHRTTARQRVPRPPRGAHGGLW